MKYKGYEARIEYDDTIGILHGTVVGLRDVITFQGECVSALRDAFADSVEDYLAMCAERGEEPDRPFSGRLLVRMSPQLHREITLAAGRAGKSLNRWIEDVLAEAVRSAEERPADGPLHEHSRVPL